MEDVFEYLWSVLRAIQYGLTLKPDVVQAVHSYPRAEWIAADWIAFGVVMTAGISLLLGQSVILFLNQIKPSRFALSLVANGLLLTIGWVIWSTTVWGIGHLLFAETPNFMLILDLIGLSYAPLAFAFFTLMPYLGPFVHRMLYVWSFLIALRAVAFSFHVGVFQALLCVGSGWLALVLLTATVGRPLVVLQNWLWHRITGTHTDLPVRELPTPISLGVVSESTPKAEKP